MSAAETKIIPMSPARAHLATLIDRRAELTAAMASQIQSVERLQSMLGAEAAAKAALDAFDKAAGDVMETWLRAGGTDPQPPIETAKRKKLVQAVDAAAGRASAARSASASIEADYLRTATEANSVVPLVTDAVATVVSEEAAPLLEEAHALRKRLASTLAKLNCLPPKLFEAADRLRPGMIAQAAHHSRMAEGLQATIKAVAAPIAGPMDEAEQARRRLEDLWTRLSTDATARSA
jgi:hypothetical protein